MTQPEATANTSFPLRCFTAFHHSPLDSAGATSAAATGEAGGGCGGGAGRRSEGRLAVNPSSDAGAPYRNLAGYGPLETLLADDDVWAIMVNSPEGPFNESWMSSIEAALGS